MIKTVSLFIFLLNCISEMTVIISVQDCRIRLLRFVGNCDFTQVHVIYSMRYFPFSLRSPNKDRAMDDTITYSLTASLSQCVYNNSLRIIAYLR